MGTKKIELTRSMKEDALNLFNSGKTIKRIAEILGIVHRGSEEGYKVIQDYLYDIGKINRRFYKGIEERRKELLEMQDSGMSNKAIAKEFGVAVATISTELVYANSHRKEEERRKYLSSDEYLREVNTKSIAEYKENRVTLKGLEGTDEYEAAINEMLLDMSTGDKKVRETAYRKIMSCFNSTFVIRELESKNIKTYEDIMEQLFAVELQPPVWFMERLMQAIFIKTALDTMEYSSSKSNSIQAQARNNFWAGFHKGRQSCGY